MPLASECDAVEIDGVPADLSRSLIAVIRGWHTYERTHGGPPIVDFDLCNAGKLTKFGDRSDILDALIDLHESLRGSAGSAPFLRSRLGGSIAYLRTLMGQALPFEEYIEETLGVRPTFVPEDELAMARNEVSSLLETCGLRYRREDRGLFEERFILHDPAAIMKGILEGKDLWLSRLRGLSIPVPETINISVRFVRVDAYWANWISGKRATGFKLAINLHPRKKYQKGSPLALCLHEICGHAAQMAIWESRIRAGLLSEACGITTVHSPEAFNAEGLGQTIHLLFARKFFLPFDLRLRKAQQYHELLVMQNAHLLLYQGGQIEKVLRYADHALPFSYRAEVEMDLCDRIFDPLSRTYQLSYSVAERMIRGVVNCMTDSQTERFFSHMFQLPMSPHQLASLGDNILSNS